MPSRLWSSGSEKAIYRLFCPPSAIVSLVVVAVMVAAATARDERDRTYPRSKSN